MATEPPNKPGPLVDLHVDTLSWLSRIPYRFDRLHRPWSISPLLRPNHVDLPRLKEAGVRFVWWGIVPNPFVPRPSKGVFKTLRYVHRLIQKHSQELHLVQSPEHIEGCLNEDKIGCILTIEGGHALEGNLGMLERYREQGVRAMTLVHLTDNDLSPCSRKGRTGQLTSLGKEAVREMERLGIVVDAAHLPERGIEQLSAVSRLPFVCSHGAAHSVCPHWRNLSDDSIRMIGACGGLVGAFFIREWIRPDRKGSIEDVVSHLERIKKVAGPSVPAIGSDFDGAVRMARGIEDVRALPRLEALLMRQGWDPADCRGVMGMNAVEFMRRVFSEVP